MISLGNLNLPDGKMTLGNTSIKEISLGYIKVWPFTQATAYINPASLNFASGATTGTLYVTDTSNHGWTLQGGGSMATLSKYAGTGDTTITVSVSQNPGSSQRTATLTFTDRYNSQTQTVSLTQAAAPAPANVYLEIAAGTYNATYPYTNAIDWTLSWDMDQTDIISSNYFPIFYGDNVTWGENDVHELIPTSEYGSYKTVFYDVVVLDSNGNILYRDQSSAEVYIPENPAQSEYIIQLPNL